MKNLILIAIMLFTLNSMAQFEPQPTDSVDVQMGKYNFKTTLQDVYDIIDTYPNLQLYEHRAYITEEILGYEIQEHDIFIEPINYYEH